MNRRGFLLGLGALAAPAIIRTPGLLMPVRPATYEIGFVVSYRYLDPTDEQIRDIVRRYALSAPSSPIINPEMMTILRAAAAA